MANAASCDSMSARIASASALETPLVSEPASGGAMSVKAKNKILTSRDIAEAPNELLYRGRARCPYSGRRRPDLQLAVVVTAPWIVERYWMRRATRCALRLTDYNALSY